MKQLYSVILLVTLCLTGCLTSNTVLHNYEPGSLERTRVLILEDNQALEALHATIHQAKKGKKTSALLAQRTVSANPIQTQKNLDSIYADAGAAFPAYEAFVRECALTTHSEAMVAPLKSRERAVEKIMSDYGGMLHAYRIKDILRASLVYENTLQLFAGLEWLHQNSKDYGYPILKLNNRFSSHDSDVYRDININLGTPNGMVTELQLHVRTIQVAKEKGHPFYEKTRTLVAEAENAPLVEKKQMEQKIKELEKEASHFYEEAWENTNLISY